MAWDAAIKEEIFLIGAWFPRGVYVADSWGGGAEGEGADQLTRGTANNRLHGPPPLIWVLHTGGKRSFALVTNICCIGGKKINRIGKKIRRTEERKSEFPAI